MANMRNVPLDDIAQETLEFIINHVFLPPKLPQKADEGTGGGNAMLLKLIQHAAETYTRRITMETLWKPVVEMLKNLCELESSDSHSASTFSNAVRSMKTGDVIALHIGAQNAGLILRQSEDTMVFESFEASPKTADVIGTKGKLLCTYPGPAIAVGLEKVKDLTFLQQLGSFIEKMKRDVLGQAVGRGSKAGLQVSEERETSHPKFITEMLTGILRAIGSPAPTQRIQKRIADDVLWDNAKIPWRRSPLWLVVRVALQTTLKLPDGTHIEYKAFMVFFMAKILDLAIRKGFPVDILFTMNAKLSRRVYKARDRMSGFVLDEARRVGDRAYDVLCAGWAQAQSYHAAKLDWRPHPSGYSNDAYLTMLNSRDYVRAVRTMQCSKPERESFVPSEAQRFDTSSSNMPELSGISTSAVIRDITLADFELWVTRNLDNWLAVNLNLEGACDELGERIDDYISAAKPLYVSNPERTSILILTTMELWVALDKLTVKHCPLLSDYYPEFTDSFLAPLLLPQAQQRIRLHKIEQYLKTRRAEVSPMSVSVFSNAVTDKTFAVRYFDGSPLQKDLEKEIREHAIEERDRKKAEFKERQQEFDKLHTTIRTRSCDYFTHRQEGWTKHDWKCRKCAMVTKADRMRIEVHEWPLPDDDLQCKAVVFELLCPLSFSVWRDITYRILVDLCTSTQPLPDDAQKPYESLNIYSGLKQYFQNLRRSRARRLHWTSFTKSFLKSHYRHARFPTTVQDICVNNALRYGLYDNNGRQWTKDWVGECDIRHACTFRLPDGPYKKLQYTVRSTFHTPNQVISRQYECPPELQLHEYIAFGMLRAGSRVQWLNMLRELRSRTLTFNNEAVNMLFVQSAWQAGPPGRSEVCRGSHVDLEEYEFGKQFLSELDNMLKSIRFNWQEIVAVQTLITLAAQLLSIAKYQDIIQHAISFLREARRVCLGWTRELSRKLPDCKPGDVREFQLRVVQMAAVCRATYDVEHYHLDNLLHSDEDVAVLVECTTTIHDNVPAIVDTLSGSTRTLLDRDRRLSYAIEDHLRSLILNSNTGLDLTDIWSVYRPGSPWQALPEPNSRWIFTYTAAGLDSCSQKVHYNLLSGKLLVEGLPLGRMPSEYTSHQTYKELFGEKVLDVFPSNMDGMIFQAKHEVSGHKVAFAMHENELMIRTQRTEDSATHQLIPRSKLKGDFPEHIIADHLHWLEISSGIIELREQDSAWCPKSSESWYIYDSYSPESSVLYFGLDVQLLDIRSPTTFMITSVLCPLEYAEFIDIRYSSGEVSARLPRLKLEFFINRRGGLECRQFPDMVVDNDQSIGTLVGLQNRLVVRQGSTRSVIIPYGRVQFEQYQSHIKVEIDTKNQERVKYHIYTINHILGLLVGNGSLTSHLYKIYLHAVTAYCLPDPLTRRTGTEEALAGLRAAATWSFQMVETDGVDTNLFKLIASLTPERVYYPPHLKLMQQVKWNCLSPIAQHDEFITIVGAVSNYASLLRIFEEEGTGANGPTYARSPSDSDLLRRAALRNANFRTEEFGGSVATRSEDQVYSGRDATQESPDEARVWYVAGLVERWPSRLNVCSRLMEVLEKWGEIQGPGEEIELGYDHKWLDQDLADVWCALYEALRQSSRHADMYQWMFLLTTLAYSGKVELDIIETLLAFATVSRFQAGEIPQHTSYDLGHGFKPDSAVLFDVVKGCAIDFDDSDEAVLSPIGWESEAELQQRRYKTYIKNMESQARSLVNRISLEWPCTAPVIPDDDYSLLDVPEGIIMVKPFLEQWLRNSDFQDHIEMVQYRLDSINSREKRSLQFYSFSPCSNTKSSVRNTIRFEDLLARDPPTLRPPPILLVRNIAGHESMPVQLPTDDGLESLLRDFRSRRRNRFRKKYADGLEESFEAFQAQCVSTDSINVVGLVDRLKTCKAECEAYLNSIFRSITECLSPLRLKGGFMAYKAGLWPRISPILLLQQLATNGQVKLSAEWKAVFVTFGKAITMLQRIERLLKLAHRPDAAAQVTSDFLKELANTGHQEWDPVEQPDWLLIEIENNLLVRPVQADIASQMISPPENKNSIMQLCMGEGKTSVIVPIVAAALADGSKLVRVVVLKPLSGQMFQTLVQKLGGLVNRRIFFMPFSRGIRMGKEEINVAKQLYDECMQSGGILLVQPEHMLSFKLLGLEWLYNSRHKKESKSDAKSDKSDEGVAQILLDTQRWLEDNSRDILDESDEILNVRHELIYTIGNPAPIQNHPDRWVIIQEIFDLIKQHFREIDPNPGDFEVETHEQEGRFGFIRILNMEAGRKFLRDVASKIIGDQLLTISFRLFPPDKRRLAGKFITDPEMNEQESVPLLKYFGDNDISNGILFLLRGLIAHNILLFSLKEKRWKVDYGLDLKRSMLAVPYRAKDSPAGKAEFSHPDVTITLTCLSYYYGGLSESQLETCFRNLYKSDNPALEYERWLKGVRLPNDSFKHLNGINLEDRRQWKDDIFPTFNYNKSVIDFYLAGVVFPKEAKEFPHKLSTSGWDIAGEKFHPTTGFSGTNDNRYLLPLSIEQLDTTEQLNTNAKVLSYLLQEENSYICTAGPNDERINVEQLLQTLTKMSGGPIRVLLDVGAQVLELRNDQVAEKWLSMVPEYNTQAAVYFNDNDELTVITRDGIREPLMVSAFAEQLNGCLVYLDEAHTRGTDLKLPPRSRAAVTLGPNLTKDRLVQACMRMRKLGNGHSVLFCGPPEIHRKIFKLAQQDNRDSIKVRDVLYWCMEETCTNARKLLPIWAKQGIGYQKHHIAWDDINNGKKFPKGLLEKEAKTLQEHYGFQRSKDDNLDGYHPATRVRDAELARIKERCSDFGVKSFRGARMLEEQERELAHEVECERENQRPANVGALKHNISDEVRRFITTGTLPQFYHSIFPAFDVLSRTSVKEHWQGGVWPKGLLATMDFCQVVERGRLKDDLTDDFLRPVNWILSSTVDRSILVIISPYEVNQLLPRIRESQSVILHMYSPQVTRTTPSYERLDFCAIPELPHPWSPNVSLIDQLNIFAGQLYFRNYKAYERVCGFLGLYLNEPPMGNKASIRSDGFVDRSDRQLLRMKQESPFTKSQVTLLRALMGFRRKGQSYIATHMGYVLHGRLLTAEDFKHASGSTQ